MDVFFGDPGWKETKNFSIDPSDSLSQQAAHKNLTLILSSLSKLLDFLVKSSDECPIQIRQILVTLSETMSSRVENSINNSMRFIVDTKKIKSTVRSYLFLRILSPVLILGDHTMSGASFGARLLQIMANQSSWTGVNHPFSEEISDFLQRSSPFVECYVEKVADARQLESIQSAKKPVCLAISLEEMKLDLTSDAHFVWRTTLPNLSSNIPKSSPPPSPSISRFLAKSVSLRTSPKTKSRPLRNVSSFVHLPKKF